MTCDEEPTDGPEDRATPPRQEPRSADRSRDAALAPWLAARRRAVRPAITGVRAHGRHVHDELAEAGMATAEYAIATLAAVGFAGLLVAIMRGNEVKGFLLAIIRQALGQ